MVGILRGAKAKFDSGIIGKKEYNEIKNMISTAEYESFFPVLYIIKSEKVKSGIKNERRKAADIIEGKRLYQELMAEE